MQVANYCGEYYTNEATVDSLYISWSVVDETRVCLQNLGASC
jgi:hypothetical protein